MAMLADYLTTYEYLRTCKNSHPPSLSSTSTFISLGNWGPSSSWNLICKVPASQPSIYYEVVRVLVHLFSLGRFPPMQTFLCPNQRITANLKNKSVLWFLVTNKTKIEDQWWTQSPHSKRGKKACFTLFTALPVFPPGEFHPGCSMMSHIITLDFLVVLSVYDKKRFHIIDKQCNSIIRIRKINWIQITLYFP